MKLYECRREENERIIKILGLTFMHQTSDYMTAERLQSFLCGLVTTIKINDPYSNYSKKDIKFLGLPVIRRVEGNNYRTYYIFGKPVKKVSIEELFKKEYFKYIDKKYDDIYILNANSGETYLTLTYVIDALIKKKGSKNPLIVATLPYHTDLVRMICPDIPYVYTKRFKITGLKSQFKIDNFRFFLIFAPPHFKQVETDIKNNPIGEHHYFKSILKKLDVKQEDISMRKIAVPPEDEHTMLEKAGKIGLNLDKFVFLSPEAQSCKLYDEDFWNILINKLHDKGYDIFVNLVGGEIKLKAETSYKTCDLTFAQAFALAKRAKKIVSLRSGFTEFLLQTGVPIDVLYTKFKCRTFFDDMDIYHVMSGFGITQIPFVDKSKIQEFNTFEMTQAECIKKVTKAII